MSTVVVIQGRCPLSQLRASDECDSASCIHPHRTSFITQAPIDRITGQTAAAVERRDAAIFDATEASVRAHPERTVWIQPNVVYPPARQTVRMGIGLSNVAIHKMRDAVRERNP